MIIVHLISSIFLLLLQAANLWADEGLYIKQIAIHPDQPQVIFASTYNEGVLRSSDSGKSWKLSNEGIKSYLIYQLLFDRKNPEILFMGSWGGGIYRSLDGGGYWEERSRGLENTAVTALLMSPDNTTLYAATNKGVYKGSGGGESWESFNAGLTLLDNEVLKCMIEIPSADTPVFVLGTNRGIYRWIVPEKGWEKAGDDLSLDVTTMTYQSYNQRIFAGTISSGIYISEDLGKRWRPYADPGSVWINQIVIHPSDPMTIYIATRDRGLMKTRDSGKTWSEANAGIDDQWVNTIAMDPGNPEIIYAGTHEHGIFISGDGGKKWRGLLKSTIQSKEARNDALIPRAKHETDKGKPIPSPPEAIKKCSDCHGWTDHRLDFHAPTYYRAAANRRDWTSTVMRMSRRAQLTSDEEIDIIKYLNTYYGMD